MKYANIEYTGRNYINMGDVLLTLAVDHLYELMGIDGKSVVKINYKNLSDYNGEEVLLPIASAFMGYHDGKHITCFSSKIVPLFLSFNIMATTLNEDDILYLKKFSPIGCRDRHTYETMRKYSIPAYVNGCLTITMDFKEKKRRKNEKALWVDVPQDLEPYIPEQYKINRKVYSQIRSLKGINNNEISQKVYNAYLTYFEEAKIVITSRLHCAIPCIMAGIPVVFAGKDFDYRFSWMERYIRFYDKNEYDLIDWNPDINASLFSVRDDMKRFSIERIKYTMHQLEYAERMTEKIFLGQRKYKIGALEWVKCEIEKLYEKTDEYDYAIWGMGQFADLVYSYVTKVFSKAHFLGLCDSNITGVYQGITIKKPEEIFRKRNLLVVVAATTIAGEEKKAFEEKFERNKSRGIFLSDYSTMGENNGRIDYR